MQRTKRSSVIPEEANGRYTHSDLTRGHRRRGSKKGETENGRRVQSPQLFSCQATRGTSTSYIAKVKSLQIYVMLIIRTIEKWSQTTNSYQ